MTILENDVLSLKRRAKETNAVIDNLKEAVDTHMEKLQEAFDAARYQFCDFYDAIDDADFCAPLVSIESTDKGARFYMTMEGPDDTDVFLVNADLREFLQSQLDEVEYNAGDEANWVELAKVFTDMADFCRGKVK